jgi:hypothetical protein
MVPCAIQPKDPLRRVGGEKIRFVALRRSGAPDRKSGPKCAGEGLVTRVIVHRGAARGEAHAGLA